MLYLINYDLRKPGENYTNLVHAVQSYGSWAKIGYSCWAVRTNQTAAEIRNYLMGFVDQNDVLFVCEFKAWASWNITPEAQHWLEN